MPGRPIAWTPGNPAASLPILLPAYMRTKGRISLPAQIFDLLPWLFPAKQGAMAVAVEVRGLAHIRIIPREEVDRLLGTDDADLTAAVVIRTFVARIGEDRRLSLPDILGGTVFPEWPRKSQVIKVLIECHATHFEIMSPEAWLAIVKQGPDIEELLDRSNVGL